MNKWVLASILLLGSAPLASAQQGSWLKRTFTTLTESLTSLNPHLDQEYIFQPELPWNVGPSAEFIGAGFTLKSDIITNTEFTDLEMEDRFLSGRGYFESSLEKRLYKKAGGSIGYGALSLGYSVEVARKSPGKNTYFNFGLLKPNFGVRTRFYEIHEFGDQTFVLDMDEPENAAHSRTEKPARMRTFDINGYYAVNDSQFAYTATYKGSVVQRHSAGSWMLSARYTQGELMHQSSEVGFIAITNDIGRYTTLQMSLGGGYSYNWVLFHRDPRPNELVKGMRNLTLNITVMPMFTVLNYLRTWKYVYPPLADTIDAYVKENGLEELNLEDDEQFDRFWEYYYNLYHEEKQELLRLKPGFSFIASAGLCFTWDRFFLTASIDYNRLRFRGSSTNIYNDEDYFSEYTVATKGSLYDATAKIQLNVRF